MTKRTKRALVSSALALLLCFTMLLGTTYAWFTDSVTTVNNKIVAGNLDIELYSAFQPEDGVLDDADWTMVDATTNIFEEGTLWEPGHVEVAYLWAKNVGTLALEWDLAINIVDEVTSTSVLGNELVLSSYLKAQLVEVDGAFANRAEAVAAVTAGYGLTEYTDGGVLYPEGAGVTNKMMALIVYMPEEVGNEANYAKGAAVPSIDMGITLLATQTPYENDSFGNDYDEDATYPGGNVGTGVLNKILSEANDGDTIYLEPMNYNLVALSSGAYSADYPANLTIIGDAGTTITGFSIGDEVINGWTLKNITFVGNKNDNAGNTDGISVTTKATVNGLTIEGCTFANGADIDFINTTNASFSDVVVKDCVFTGIKTKADPAILLQGVTNITVDNCLFDGVNFYNAIQTNKTKGEFVFTNNTIKGTTDRAIRVANKGANLTITGNTVISDGDVDGQLLKASGMTGTETVTLSGNTWNGKTDAEVTAGLVGTDYIITK